MPGTFPAAAPAASGPLGPTSIDPNSLALAQQQQDANSIQAERRQAALTNGNYKATNHGLQALEPYRNDD